MTAISNRADSRSYCPRRGRGALRAAALRSMGRKESIERAKSFHATGACRHAMSDARRPLADHGSPGYLPARGGLAKSAISPNASAAVSRTAARRKATAAHLVSNSLIGETALGPPAVPIRRRAETGDRSPAFRALSFRASHQRFPLSVVPAPPAPCSSPCQRCSIDARRGRPGHTRGGARVRRRRGRRGQKSLLP